MGAHLIDGEFQSDKYPSTPRGKVPLSVRDVTAQDLLWQYAQRRRSKDAEFSDDLEVALMIAGYKPPHDEACCTQCAKQSLHKHACTCRIGKLMEGISTSGLGTGTR